MGHGHLLQCTEPVDTSIYLHVIYTQTSMHMCCKCKCEHVKAFSFMMCVVTKAHSFYVIELSQPVKTIRATGLENIQTAPWDVKAIPDDTALGLLRLSES